MTKNIIALSLLTVGLSLPISMISNDKTEKVDALIAKEQGVLEEEIAIKAKERERLASVGFNENDIRIASNLTANELRGIFKSIPSASNMEDLAPAFVKAEQTYEVNAIVLSSIVALESNWNTSRRALECFNLTGYAVYSNDSSGRHFLSPEECILETAKLLKEDYLSENGIWHNGYSIKSINTMYSSDKYWYTKVVRIGNDLLSEFDNIINKEVK